MVYKAMVIMKHNTGATATLSTIHGIYGNGSM